MFLKNWKTVSPGQGTTKEGEKKTRWSLCLDQCLIWGEFSTLSMQNGISRGSRFSPSSQDRVRFKPAEASGNCGAKHYRWRSWPMREIWRPVEGPSGLLLWPVLCMGERKLPAGGSKQNNLGSSHRIRKSLIFHHPEWKDFIMYRTSGWILRRLSCYYGLNYAYTEGCSGHVLTECKPRSQKLHTTSK